MVIYLYMIYTFLFGYFSKYNQYIFWIVIFQYMYIFIWPSKQTKKKLYK